MNRYRRKQRNAIGYGLGCAMIGHLLGLFYAPWFIPFAFVALGFFWRAWRWRSIARRYEDWLDEVVTIETECTIERGPFWGIDDSGWRPECGTIITAEIYVADLLDYGPGPEWGEDPETGPPIVRECPKCGTLLEWPQTWSLEDGEPLRFTE